MGAEIARRGLNLVYGGGCTGMMGALADGALDQGGTVTGVLPQAFDVPELAHPRLSEKRVVSSMHARKALMAELADAFVALPGGLGTLEELFEILTWAQLGLHSRPVGVLNVHGYFDPLLTVIEHARREGFIYDEHRRLLLAAFEPGRLLELLAGYEPPPGLGRWLWRRGDS
jgi:hypothetical protein